MPLVALWGGCLAGFGFASSTHVLALIAIGLIGFAYRLFRGALSVRFLGIVVVVGVVLSWAHWKLNHSDQAQWAFAQMPVGQMTFVVRSDPVISETKGINSLSFNTETRFMADLLTIDGQSMHIPVAVSLNSGNQRFVMTETWRCDGSIAAATGLGRVAGFLHCRGGIQREKFAARYQSLATDTRSHLVSLTAGRHPDHLGAQLLPGLVVGDTSAQSDEVTRALRIAGLGHLTAVSGANVAIVIAALAWLLSHLHVRPRWRYVALVCGVIAFMVVARPSASVVRASVMASIALTLWVTGSQRRSEVVVLATGLVLLVIDPWLAVSWGFALSLAATLGLILLPRLWGISADSPWWQRLLAASVAACLATIPLLIAMGATPTLATIPANVTADFFVAPATIFGVLATVLSLCGLDLFAVLCADAGCMAAQAIVSIAQFFSESPLAISMLSWQSLFLIALTVWLWRDTVFPRPTRIAVGCIGAALILVLQVLTPQVHGWPASDWEMLACDVGQGDAALVKTGVASAIVIDVGGEPDLIDKCLESAHIDHVDLLIISHLHQDHVGGIAGVRRGGRTIGRTITAAFGQPAAGLQLLRREVHGPVEVAYAGMSGRSGSVRWQVLMALDPTSAVEPDGTTINSSSVVLLVQTAHWKILFTGDIETAAQQQLMSAMAPPAIDLVKVPHHGSRAQDPAFAGWVQAAAAWISVGADNPYGHPSPETLRSYRAARSAVFITRDCGAIAATALHTLVSEHGCSGVG